MRYRQQVQRRMDARTKGNLTKTLARDIRLSGQLLPLVGIVLSHIYKDPNQKLILYPIQGKQALFKQKKTKKKKKKKNKLSFPSKYPIFSNSLVGSRI